MKHRDNDYLRRRPDHQYGSNEQGYSGIPAQARNRRQRNLTAGRYGNTAERLPRDETRPFEADESWYGVVESWRWGPGPEPWDEARYEDEWSRRRRAPYGEERWAAGRGDWYGGPAGPRYRGPGSSGGYGAQDWDEPAYRRSGPKNYRRGDDRIHDEVCDRLAHAQELDVSEVTVRVQDGLVTLEGHVGDRRSKYDIEDIAERVFGVQDVINHIHVRPYGILASE
ncbi:BON domain-containing protein [Cupriavidus taiwanensis]|uniref:BON domain-containing protein n=1 Tax=Cupriavidus taiwanensis TaxID=164546 RepID=UPI0015730FF9|nr:BON domain-containing protein [Cupriavidus taiwanensis]NSX15483.1 BON domain-containing protein [Cupriavidus taiwanensis]